MNDETIDQAYLLVLRAKLGKLRSWHTFMPPVLRKQYLELLDDIAGMLGA